MKVHTRIWARSPESSSYALECTTVSPLHTNLQIANSKMQTHLHVQSRKLVHTPGVHCHMSGVPHHVRASSTSGCAFVYFTVQYCIKKYSTISPSVILLVCSLDVSPCMPAVVLYY